MLCENCPPKQYRVLGIPSPQPSLSPDSLLSILILHYHIFESWR